MSKIPHNMRKLTTTSGGVERVTKHEPKPMKFVGKCPHKSRPTRTFRFGKNIWKDWYECEVCGDRLGRLSNLHIKSTPICDGKKYAKQNALRRSHFKMKQDSDLYVRIEQILRDVGAL